MSRPARRDRLDYIGLDRYFLTFCARSRSAAFGDAGTARETLAQFVRTAAEEHFSILAYGLMPDHVHLLVAGPAAHANLRRFAKMSKQRSGARHALKSGAAEYPSLGSDVWSLTELFDAYQ